MVVGIVDSIVGKKMIEEIINKQGLKCKISNYKNSKDIDVIFGDGYIAKNKRYEKFISGSILNPNIPSVLGVGVFGDGVYNYKKDLYVYKAWSHMITRCYDNKYSDKFPTYINCKVDKYFLNFQNFAKWYYDNVWSSDIKLCLDKDILIKNNKIYSPSNCILVDTRINSLFTRGNAHRGDTPIGTSIDKRYNLPRAHIMNKGKQTTKYFKTIEGAFMCYKNFKESYIKQVADEYKSKYPNFPQKLYDAMHKYEVDITD